MTMRSKTKLSILILSAIAVGLMVIPVAAKPAMANNVPVAADGNIFQALFLGLVQGITEFFPISSTAHLLVTTKAFGWQQLGQKDYADAIQFGSVIAVFIYFWKDISQCCWWWYFRPTKTRLARSRMSKFLSGLSLVLYLL